MDGNLLEIKGLKTYFNSEQGAIPAVNGVDITIRPGEVVGIVGESGCGKSVTALSVMSLFKGTSGKVVDGSIQFQGRSLLSLSAKEMRRIRGNEIAMVFQEPMTSLNPSFKIGKQICEGIQLHLKYSKEKARQHTIDMLKLVEIPRPEEVYYSYPYQLSGGMRQRVMIAMAMSCDPKLLIADEPTTALDVTIQAQILNIMKRLKDEKQTSIMLITHDLGVVAEMCDRVVVMYTGKVVEEATVNELFKNPKHPYTKALLRSMPKIGENKDRLSSISGNVPSLSDMPQGCKFAPRCPEVIDVCTEQEVDLLQIGETHLCRCWLYYSETKEVHFHE